MPISGYFDTPFGIDGTLVTVPDGVQSDGSVSYNQGWGVDYTLPSSNPSYKYMPQGQFNQLFFDITSAIQNWQQNTIAPFITSTMNGGSPYTYPQYALVLYGGVAYLSNTGSNTDTPPSSKWTVLGTAAAGSLTGTTLASNVVNAYLQNITPAGYTFSVLGATTGSLYSIVNNSDTGASCYSLFQLKTGTSNSFLDFGLGDGAGTPFGFINCGSSISYFILDSSPSTTSAITIKSGSGGITLNPNGGTVTLGTVGSGTWHGTPIAGATYVTALLSTAVSKSAGTIYQAATDGFLYGSPGAANNVTVYTDSSSTPTTVRMVAGDTGGGAQAAAFCCPIRKNDYYECVLSAGSMQYLFFSPMGA